MCTANLSSHESAFVFIYSVTVHVYKILLSGTGFTKNHRVLQEADADAAFEEPTVYWVTRPMKDQKMRLQNWAGEAF